MIYFDNAATSWPKPESVYRACDEFLRESCANPGRSGHSMAVVAQRAVEDTRLQLARLLNAASDHEIVFTLNCTDALNLALKGLLRANDHVVTDAIGHNSLVRPLRVLERAGVAVTRVPPLRPDGGIAPEHISAAITSRTRLIALTHASNVIGALEPIEAVGEVAARHRIPLLVDAAQTVGAIPIDVRAANVALLAFPGHKSLLGPPGTGGLYVRSDVELSPVREGGTGVASELEEQPTSRPQCFESGTLNTVGIAGLGAGVRFLLQTGVAEVRRHEMALTSRALEGLRRIPGVTIHGPLEAERRVGLISFSLRGLAPAELGAILDQSFDIKLRTGLHCAPAAHRVLGTLPLGCARISFSYFCTTDQVDELVGAVRALASGSVSAC
jgi:cysteine desulfurase family protein